MLDRLVERLEKDRPRGTRLRHWSLYGVEQRVLSLGIKDRTAGGAHTPLTIAESCGARYLFVWEDGLVSRGTLERRELEAEGDAALERARASRYDDPDAARVLGPAPMPEVEMHDDDAAAMAGGESSLLAPRLEAVRRRVRRHGFRTWSGSFSASAGESRLRTSAGLDVSSRGTSATWHVSLDGEIGDGLSSRAPEPAGEFEARLDRLVKLATLLRTPASTRPAGERPVLLHPHVVERYVLSTLVHNLSGSTIANDEGHFRRESFGAAEPALRPDLTLRLDPLAPLRGGSYRFTPEGVPAARCTFVERGRLLRPMTGLKYAKRLGVEPTPIAYSMDTLHLEAARVLPFEQALGAATGGVLVLSVLGVHTQDSASGDFSLSAPQSLRIEDGGLDGRLRCTISGNLFRVLRDERLDLVRFEGEHTPGLLFPCRVA